MNHSWVEAKQYHSHSCVVSMFVSSECLEAVVLSVVVLLLLKLTHVALVQLDSHQGRVGHIADLTDPTALSLVTHWHLTATMHRLHTSHTIEIVIDNFIDVFTDRVSITGVVVVMRLKMSSR